MTTYTRKITRQVAALALAVFTIASAASGVGRDNNPHNAGESQARNAWGAALDGAMGNPALLGLDQPPRYGLSVLPLSVALWSDKLAPPLDLRALIDPPSSAAYYFAKFLNESFNLTDDPAKNSEILTKGLRDGIGVYAGAKASPAAFATRGFGLSFSTFADAYAKVPGGFLLPIFSDTSGPGLLAGNTLDVSGMRLEAVWASEIAVKLGYSTTVPFFSDYLGLDIGAAGVGMKALLGHAYLRAKTQKDDKVFYDTASNKYKADATLTVLSAGTGFDGNFRYDYDYLPDNKINGEGWGIDLGAVFRNRKHALSIDIQDIGMIFWNGGAVRKGEVSFNPKLKDGFDLTGLPTNIDDLFGLDSTLKLTGKNYIQWLPTTLNAGYSYSMRFGGELSIFLGYITAGLCYSQPLALGVGYDAYLPRLSAGAAFGLLDGNLPVRYGLIVGGRERLASSVGVGLDAKHVSIDFFYKAVGSPAPIPERGFEIGSGLTIRWGYAKNKVKDAPEPPAPPSSDFLPWGQTNDAQEPPIPPVSEFFPDDDSTEVVYEPIEISMAMQPPPEQGQNPPTTPPEQAPEQAEPPRQPTEEETRALGASQRAINFMPGSAVLTINSYVPLKAIADLLARYPHIRYEVQGHSDSHGAEMYNLLLSAERAAVVKYYLMSLGVPEANLVAVGYGKNIPIADNNTAVGRALNRRVDFVQILSQEHYDWVKRFELEMIPRLTDRIIYGKPMMETKKAGE